MYLIAMVACRPNLIVAAGEFVCMDIVATIICILVALAADRFEWHYSALMWILAGVYIGDRARKWIDGD